MPSILDALSGTNADQGFKTPEKNPVTQARSMNMPSTSFTLPEEIRPFPKAGPRLENKKNIRKRKSSIYTDTPEKENLKELKIKRQSRKTLKKIPKITQGKFKGTSKDKGKGKGKKLFMRQIRGIPNDEEDESDEDETFCLECTESYSLSVPGEEWIQCTTCK